MTVIRRAHGRPARVLAALAAAAPVAAALVLASPLPAEASSGSITAPGSEAVFTSGSSVDVKASVSLSNHTSATLTVNGPGLGSGYNTSRAYDCTSSLTHSCSSSQGYTLTISVPISDSTANGAFSVALSGSVSDSERFYTNFAPNGTPSNLAAAPVGRTEVDLSWSYSGNEPDKAGFEINESHNGSPSRSITVPASVCNGSSCGYAITGYPEPQQGQTESYSYTVTALRQSGGCGSCGSYTRSSPSSSAGAQLVGPPPPTPTPTPTGGTTGGTTGGATSGATGGSSGGATGGTTGGSSGGATGGTSTGGSSSGGSSTGGSGSTTGKVNKPIAIPSLPPVVASRRAFALGFNHFSPSLGIPKLPPLPALTSPVTAGSNGTYQPVLPYKPTPQKKSTNVLTSPISAVTSLDTAQLAKCLAVALLLLVCAAHVRTFVSAHDED